MKIGNNPDRINGSSPSSSTDAAAAVKPEGKAAPLDQGVEASVKVSLSASADKLRGGGQVQEFDQAKVSQVKSAIDNGTYEVNAEVIADKLISNAQELLSRR